MSGETLLKEANELIVRAREELKLASLLGPQETPSKKPKTPSTRRHDMSTELTPQRASELYTSGQTVNEIAVSHGISYSKARKILISSGVEIRNASDRLKGRTRKAGA